MQTKNQDKLIAAFYVEKKIEKRSKTDERERENKEDEKDDEDEEQEEAKGKKEEEKERHVFKIPKNIVQQNDVLSLESWSADKQKKLNL